ncbi:hypothetical protein RND71_043469 [Anisodus tanguticus]|uniref:IRS-type PTB domain-containing protein n=1 Tax=Anisodus tanguticus TaxID=243964 RepID=A0AAE1QPI0_9SOLA|nr:hypothetical protein RND71_043469 [Anisodus tanguticus]
MATDTGDVLKQCYLKIKSKNVGVWQKRWVVLRRSSSKGPYRLDLEADTWVKLIMQECVMPTSFLNNGEPDVLTPGIQKELQELFHVYLLPNSKLDLFGECLLQVTHENIYLWDKINCKVKQAAWPLTSLRRYGSDPTKFTFEAGRHCDTGEGMFVFHTVEGEKIYRKVHQATLAIAEAHKSSKSIITNVNVLIFFVFWSHTKASYCDPGVVQLFIWKASHQEDELNKLDQSTPLVYKKDQKFYFSSSLKSKNSFITSSSYHNKTKMLVTGFSSGEFLLHELPDFNLIQSLQLTSTGQIDSLCINSTGDWIALASSIKNSFNIDANQDITTESKLVVWEWLSESFILKQVGTGDGVTNIIEAVAYSPDGIYLATGCSNGKIKVWNLITGFCFITFGEEHKGPITGLEFVSNKSGNVLISSSLDGTIRAFDLKRYRNFRTMLDDAQNPQFSCVSVDVLSGDFIAAGSQNTFEVFLFNLTTGKLLEKLTGHSAPVSDVKFSPSANILASCSWDCTLRLWSLFESAKCHRDVIQLNSDCVCLDFRPDGKEICVATMNGQLSFFDVETAEMNAACASSDYDEIHRLLDNNLVDINVGNIDGLTALHHACIDDNLELVEFLLKKGADINCVDNEGWSPLHATASCGHLEIAEFLLQHGADSKLANVDLELAYDLSENDFMRELLKTALIEQTNVTNFDKFRNYEKEKMEEDVLEMIRTGIYEQLTDNPYILNLIAQCREKLKDQEALTQKIEKEEQERKEKESTNLQANTSITTAESETQRKAHAKRARESRRSTQGILVEDVNKAKDQLLTSLKSAYSTDNNLLNDKKNTDLDTIIETTNVDQKENNLNSLPHYSSLQKISKGDSCEIVEVNSLLDNVDGKNYKPEITREFLRPYRSKITVDETDENFDKKTPLSRSRPSSISSTNSYKTDLLKNEIAKENSFKDNLKKQFDNTGEINEENKNSPIDYKKLYEELLVEFEKFKNEVSKKENDFLREKRQMQRKLSELEEELNQMENIKEDNTRLKNENGALNNYNVIVLNDRLMSETVQNEHSYFTNNISSYDGNLNLNYVDDDSNDTHSFKEMDIESECFPCIPMSSAIQLNAASFIGNHQLSSSSETRLASSPSSKASSMINISNNLTTNRNRTSVQSMSSLISVQPKNAASGTAVILTEEEKRTLIAEACLTNLEEIDENCK